MTDSQKSRGVARDSYKSLHHGFDHCQTICNLISIDLKNLSEEWNTRHTEVGQRINILQLRNFVTSRTTVVCSWKRTQSTLWDMGRKDTLGRGQEEKIVVTPTQTFGNDPLEF